jgi:alpha/beta superfamily hydrolase
LDKSQPNSTTGNGREQSVNIESGELTLEGILVLTEKKQQPGLVLCHPHPLYGGSMDDSRILALSHATATKGLNTLRFNFRGVGRSQGQFGQGLGEIQDTIAAMEFLRSHSHIDTSRVALLGYSFGGSMALAASMDANPTALVTISAPIRITDIDPGLVTEGIRYVNCPVYIVHGRDDDSVHSVEAEGIYAQLQVKEKYLRLIKGANHFWTRRLNFIIPMILAFLTDKLGMK